MNATDIEAAVTIEEARHGKDRGRIAEDCGLSRRALLGRLRRVDGPNSSLASLEMIARAIGVPLSNLIRTAEEVERGRSKKRRRSA